MKRDHKKYVLSLLQRGAYSRKTVERKLKDRNCPEDEVYELLSFFEELGYIDDKTYAILFVDSHPDWSGRRIRDELRSRGVSRENIDNAFEEIVVDDEQRAFDLALNWSKSGLDERKIYGRLSRRGFPSWICTTVSSSASETKEPDLPF